MATRILLADDHRLIREGLASLLEKEPGIAVVAEAGDGRAAVQLARELTPDVVIMDVAMPDLNGVEATRQIAAAVPDVKIIALSMHANETLVKEMLNAGASGYVLKMSAFDDVVKAVQAVVANERYLSPGLADMAGDRSPAASTRPTAFSILTPREREVLQLVAEGKSSKEIASLLGISPRTVDVHRNNLMGKLGLPSVAELTRYALREGLISLESGLGER